jgi:TRAP-type transport system small permease protein
MKLLLARFDHTQQMIVAGLVALSLLIMVSTVIFLVVARYVFGVAFFWGEELARYTMIYMAFLGGAVAIRTEQHPRLTIFLSMMPDKMARIVGVLTRLLMAVTLVVLFAQGLDIALNEGRMKTPALRISYFWIFIAVPIGAGAMLLQLALGPFFPNAVSVNEEDDIEEVTQ